MKKYFGVLPNLVAYACKLAFERGYDGLVSFVTKSDLIEHNELANLRNPR